MKRYFYLIGLILLTALFFSCSDSPKPTDLISTPKQLFAEQLIYEINKTEYSLIQGKILVFDDTFDVPREDWITNNLSKIVKDFIDKNEIVFNATFDCEKASSTAKIALNLKYSKQVGVVGVIPIGDFHYFRGGLTPHSINILMVVDNKDNLKLVFFEPQTQEFISLSLVEQFMRLRMIF